MLQNANVLLNQVLSKIGVGNPGFTFDLDTRFKQSLFLGIGILLFILLFYIVIKVNVVIAKRYQLKPLKVIVLSNVIALIVLTTGMMATPFTYLPTLLILGLIITSIEYFVYTKVFASFNRDVIIRYLLTSNGVLLFVVAIFLM